MNTIKTFEFAPNMSLRVVEIDGEPWFPAKDVCIAVGIAHLGSAVRTLDSDEKGVRLLHTLGGPQNTTVISESGLYALVMRSNKPIAREFRKWVTSEVLPSIRKHGMYMTQEVARETVEDPMSLMARAVVVANEQLGIMTVRAHGLDPASEQWITLNEFFKRHDIPVSPGDRKRIGRTAGGLSDSAGRERKYHRSGARLLAVETLERAARAQGVSVSGPLPPVTGAPKITKYTATHKYCPDCTAMKTHAEFYTVPTSKAHGLSVYCRVCSNKRRTARKRRVRAAQK